MQLEKGKSKVEDLIGGEGKGRVGAEGLQKLKKGKKPRSWQNVKIDSYLRNTIIKIPPPPK